MKNQYQTKRRLSLAPFLDPAFINILKINPNLKKSKLKKLFVYLCLRICFTLLDYVIYKKIKRTYSRSLFQSQSIQVDDKNQGIT